MIEFDSTVSLTDILLVVVTGLLAFFTYRLVRATGEMSRITRETGELAQSLPILPILVYRVDEIREENSRLSFEV